MQQKNGTHVVYSGWHDILIQSMDVFSILYNSILFLAAILICFYIPGKVLVHYCKFSLNSLEKYVFPIAFGFISFTFFCYIFDSIHLFPLIYPTLIVFIGFFLKNKLWRFALIQKADMYPLLLVVVLAIIFSYPLITSGIYSDGVKFVNINASDSTFHLSLIHELQHHFPPDHPGFAGARLTGYHIFADYVWAKISQLFPVNEVILFFQCASLFTALMWGIGIYTLMKRWTKSTTASLFAVFLTQYGGSFVSIMYLYGHTQLSLDSGFGMLQSFVSLINPPFSVSIVVLIFGLFSLLSFIQSKNIFWMIPTILFFGLAAEFKVYAGILILGGFLIFLGVSLLVLLLNRKFTLRFNKITSSSPMGKFLALIGTFVGIVIVFVLTYLRLAGKGGFLIYYPYWAPIDIVRFNLSFMNYDNQMYVYGQFKMWHRIVWLQIRIFLMFLFGNLGSRAIGWIFFIFYPKKKVFFSEPFTWMLIAMVWIAFFIPLLFIQSIKPFEITQMFNYFLFFSAIFGALGLAAFLNLFKAKIVKAIIIALVALVTLPSMYSTFTDYSPIRPFNIAQADYQGIKFLEQKGNYDSGIIVLPLVTDPNSFYKQDSWIHSASMMIPALTNKRAFLNDENISMPDDMDQRVKLLGDLTTIENPTLHQEGNSVLQQSIISILHRYHIAYIYSLYKLSVTDQIQLKQIYQTPKGYIYQVNDK